MATIEHKIVPYLWFDKEAEEVAQLYTSIFEDSRIISGVTLEGTSCCREPVKHITANLAIVRTQAPLHGFDFRYSEGVEHDSETLESLANC